MAAPITEQPKAPGATSASKNWKNIQKKNIAKLTGKAPFLGLGLGLPSFLEGYNEEAKIERSPDQQMNNEGLKGIVYQIISPTMYLEEIVKHESQKWHHNTEVSPVTKGALKVVHGGLFVLNRTIGAPFTLAGEFGRLITSLFDEEEGMADDLATNTVDADRRAAIFGTDPQPNSTAQAELLTPSTANQFAADPLRDSVLEGGDQIDSVTRETTNDENVGGMYNRVAANGGTLITESSYNGEKVSDQLVNVDEHQNAQVDAVTGYTLNNDDAASFDRLQMHHDDGIMDGYLDTGGGEFNSTPQTLPPIDLNSAMVTDAYQHQNAPGADLIVGEPNQGMDPYQAQRVQYEVLA